MKIPGSYDKKVFIVISFELLLKSSYFKYICLKSNTECDLVIDHLYTEKDDFQNHLQLPKPKFIFSIIGGYKNFEIDKEIEKAFKIGLMKAAKTNDTWIITGGIDNGVMRLVGDAVDEDLNSNNLTVLGIVDRKRICGTYPNFKRSTDREIHDYNKNLLNANHSSFVVVGNEETNSENEYYLEFRIKLEHFIHNKLKIPFFLIVLEGAYSSFHTIAQTLENKAPIILIAVSYS